MLLRVLIPSHPLRRSHAYWRSSFFLDGTVHLLFQMLSSCGHGILRITFYIWLIFEAEYSGHKKYIQRKKYIQCLFLLYVHVILKNLL